jgi:hypothetical protein
MWHQCKWSRISDVARKYGRTTQQLIAEFQQAGLLGNGPSDPSPAEIKRQMAMFRAQWDETTERARWMAARTRSDQLAG